RFTGPANAGRFIAVPSPWLTVARSTASNATYAGKSSKAGIRLGSHTGDSSPVRPGRPKTLKRPRDRSENGDNCPMQQLRRRVQTHGREVLGTAHRSRIL